MKRRPTVLELFAGIGGMSLGFERAGLRVVGQVEIDPFARAILERHWPAVPRHDDVHTALTWWYSRRRPTVDCVAGGYPCQPDSHANARRRGRDDERWLWPAMAAVVAALTPRWVVAENVPGHRNRGLRFVLEDLRRLGYTASAGSVSAAQVGAPHWRERIFVIAERGLVADPDSQRRQGSGAADPDLEWKATADLRRRSADAGGPPSRWWATEPGVDRVVDGFPGRVDRLRVLGNAVVPQVAEFVGRLMLSGQWR